MMKFTHFAESKFVFVHYTSSSETNLALILKKDMMFGISLKYSVMTKGTLFNRWAKGNTGIWYVYE